jgi:hypothetical protein
MRMISVSCRIITEVLNRKLYITTEMFAHNLIKPPEFCHAGLSGILL